jgi:hypothetical protein
MSSGKNEQIACPFADLHLKESNMNHEQAVGLQPGDESMPSVIDALDLPKSLHRVAVWMLDQIKSAQSILLLASAHGRADGFAYGLEVTEAIEPAVHCYLSSIYRGAHDRRLVQLVAIDSRAMQGTAC